MPCSDTFSLRETGNSTKLEKSRIPRGITNKFVASYYLPFLTSLSADLFQGSSQGIYASHRGMKA